MVETSISKLRGLVLSANDLRSMTDWPEALVEDYLNIVHNFIKLAEQIDDIVGGDFETRWEDLRVPAQNTKLTPAKSEPAFEALGTGGLYVFKFDHDNADDESLHFVAQLPHAYKEGTEIHPHVHWCPDSTDTGNVYWEFEVSARNKDGAFTTYIIDFAVDAADGTSKKHQITSFDLFGGTSLEISAILICRLTRKGTDVLDTYTGNACFLEFDFHYQADSIGSETEWIK